MVKRIKKVTKGKITRKRKKIIVLGAEGLNKTEVLYFKELEKKQDQYHFIFAQGNDTDPIKIVKNTANKAKQEELLYKKGDMAVSIFDLDLEEAKYNQLEIAKTDAEKKNVTLLTSNPCFEVWYLQHFSFSTKPFPNSNSVIKELEKKISSYQKNHCDFELFYPNTEMAIMNCEKLDKYHADNNATNKFPNPQTNIYKLVRILIDRGRQRSLDVLKRKASRDCCSNLMMLVFGCVIILNCIQMVTPFEDMRKKYD